MFNDRKQSTIPLSFPVALTNTPPLKSIDDMVLPGTIENDLMRILLTDRELKSLIVVFIQEQREFNRKIDKRVTMLETRMDKLGKV